MSAQIQVASEVIFQFIFHECHCGKTTFIFHNSKDLNTCNLSKLYEFRKLVLEDGRRMILVHNRMT